MRIDPLAIHNHFKCSRSAFDGLEEHYYKPKVEIRVNPELDWDDFASIEELEKLIQPRLDNAGRMASAWERHLLEECLRLGVWRVWFIQWWEYKGNSAFMNTRVFPPWEIKEAQKLAKSLGEHITGLNLKRWLLMPEEQFLRESGSSQNRDVMVEMRRVLGPRCRSKCK